MLVIGHRGASVAAPENSVAAFEIADSMGADGVELDVRFAPDGRLLVKHDSLPSDPAARERLPTLDTVLAACGDMLVNVEIKNSQGDPDHDASGALVARTVAALRRHGPPERWIVSSFDWETIERCRRTAPDIPTALLVADATVDVIERTMAAGHRAVHPAEPSLTAEVVERCHAAGLAVNTWTCNDPVRIVELASIGVDGVCTDLPDVALRALGRQATGADESRATARWGRPA